ncbi:MCP four helix bundle domain-containing protein [Massilia violaceinigra]|uniref:MCP four helix bundle domain-containing protein n=1 Tax=Massilia violaceinigra TaxID=2045208 RepID=A0ABY4A9L1_9BURK|nr:methyl-accepting chemotaxis protein [Massilia violaceinigra]UOD31057.1 MCP four helix bundle domain-containing protein [Massilia violaceinigra]
MTLSNLTIAQRLGLAFGTVLALLALIAGLGILNLQRMHDDTTILVGNHWPKAKLEGEALDNARGSIARLFQMVAGNGEAQSAEALSRFEANRAAFDDALGKLGLMLRTEQGKANHAEALALRARYVQACTRVQALLGSGQREQARQLAYGEAYSAMQGFAAALRKQTAFQAGLFEEVGERGERTFASARRNLLAISAAALLSALVLACWITRSITVPLLAALRVARTVASGDLTSVIVVERADETGELLLALKGMNDALLAVVGEVRSGTEAIVTASSQIASGNMDLSARTERQAGSLEETASSMEEMTSITRRNADNARQASVLAANASQVAQQGGAAVARVVGTMRDINEASRKIADIIGVIDGIAFQTNILALNAAVEAARAGEQGRGFAVVATEVRSLAQRSAGAAREIKALIGDSVAKAGIGARQVEQAGSTMDEIVASVRRVSDIMAEIGVASGEQEAGIGQINQAIGEMDAVTQQNAALVEQAAAAAAALQQQSGVLSQVVAAFTVVRAVERA